MQRIFKVLAWSFKAPRHVIFDTAAACMYTFGARIARVRVQALAAGVFPFEDEDGRPWVAERDPTRAAAAGRPLAGGRRGAWVEMRGDWEFLWQALRLPNYYRTSNCCHLCAADKIDPEFLYTDFRRASRTRGTLRSHAAWLATVEAVGAASELVHIPGFCIWRCAFDIMHTLDLGILQHAIPSALQELAVAGGPFPGDSPEAQMVEATRAYHTWCAAHNVQSKVRRITKAWIAGPFPTISQKHAKAAALRSMLYWIRDVCVVEATANPHAAMRAAFFDSLAQADATMRRSGRFLSVEAGEALARHTEDALLCYNALSGAAFHARAERWAIVPKFHAMTHVAYDHVSVNPRHVHCYADEDMVGRVKRTYVQRPGRHRTRRRRAEGAGRGGGGGRWAGGGRDLERRRAR
jgi:hypothetical protein